MAKAATTDLIDLSKAPSRRDRKRRGTMVAAMDGKKRAYCTGTTRAGVDCPQFAQRVTIRGKRYQLKTCVMHASPAIQKELGIGEHPGGRPPKVSAPDIMRERFEAEAVRYLKPYEEALEAMRAVVVGNGASAHIQMVEDVTTRLKAAEAIMDRVFGRPKQGIDIGGGLTPVEISIPQDDQRKQDVAAILAESGALGTVIPANPSAISPTTN